MPASSPLIESCTREYRDWMEECLTPEGDERPALEEHFVWLSKDYTPYENNLGSPFIPPDFTLGLPSIQDWPHQAREPPWILNPEEYPKPVCKVLVDSTRARSMDKGKKKKKKKKKHHRSKKSEKPELKVTTQGEGANTPVWTHARPTKDSSSSLDSQSDHDSGLGCNPSIQPCLGTDTESRQGVALRLRPDTTREPIEDDPLSDQGGGDGDQDMPDANEQQGDRDPAGSRPAPVLVPDETQEGAQLGDDQMEAGNNEEPQESKEPLEPYQLFFKASGPYPRPCQWLTGPPVLKYRLSSRRAWQKPLLRTGPSYGGPLGPFANGWTLSGQQWPVQRKAPRTKPNYWQRLGRPGRMS